MRAIIFFLLSLCFLLLRGYNHVYARAHHDRMVYSPAQVPQKEKRNSFGLDHPTSLHKTLLTKEIHSTYVEENEDEDNIAARKDTIPYPMSFSYEVLASHSANIKHALPCCRHLSYTSTYKYLTQCVIRI
ncbi:hypothetical protein [Pedobacter sp. ASV28]|uniref:hypothetical protein n=1 Tax=Pedobacter sp. ASV28 TaxID=2795123 RepID=UPI0018EA6F6C|nr:hypothetical protein [Pedobacter sp. ASV28]